MSKKDIGQEIIILRAQNGWTQQQFAQKLGTTQRTVAMWESGESIPRKTMKVKIAQVFGLSDNYFLIEQEETPDDEWDKNSKLVSEFEELLSKSASGLSEEKKNKILEVFQDMIQEDRE